MTLVPAAPSPTIAERYENDVLHALTERLDQAFPEFGWQRDPRGWHATNNDYTHHAYGVRAERVVCHGDAPRGFLIHGHGPVLWTTHANHGQPARGRDFIDAVRSLAERAGVNLEIAATTVQSAAADLGRIFAVLEQTLREPIASNARAYLAERGFPKTAESLRDLGYHPGRDELRHRFAAAGLDPARLDRHPLLRDPRWEHRLVGCWRDHAGTPQTLWGRATTPDAEQRYLYLAGGRRPQTPYLLPDRATLRSGAPLLLVEGVLDAHLLHAQGEANVAALGGTDLSSASLARLGALGVRQIVLAFDNDPAGYDALRRAMDTAVTVPAGPAPFVLDPDLLDDSKDPGELIARSGVSAWHDAAIAPICGVEWRARSTCSLPSLRAERSPSAPRWIARPTGSRRSPTATQSPVPAPAASSPTCSGAASATSHARSTRPATRSAPSSHRAAHEHAPRTPGQPRLRIPFRYRYAFR